MNFQGSIHSKLVQRRIFSAALADREFSKIKENAEGYSEIPIVLVRHWTLSSKNLLAAVVGVK